MNLDMLSVVGMIFYLPGSIASLFLTERYGVRAAVLIGGIGNFISCWVRYVGSEISDSNTSYRVILFGQIIAACVQPLIVNVSSRISNDWFLIKERDLATHAMTQANVIGSAMGILLPYYVAARIPSILLCQAAVSVFALLMTALFMQSKPPTPPGIEIDDQIIMRNSYAISTSMEAIRQVITEVRLLLKDKYFVMLIVSFSGVWSSLTTFESVVMELTTPCGFDMRNGKISLSLCGVSSALVVAYIMRKFNNYLAMTKVTFLTTSTVAFWCLVSIFPRHPEFHFPSWTLLSLAAGPIMQIILEYAAEMTYPLPPDKATSVLLAAANVSCLIMTLWTRALMNMSFPVKCTIDIPPACLLMFFVIFSGTIVAMPMDHQYLRLEAAGVDVLKPQLTPGPPLVIAQGEEVYAIRDPPAPPAQAADVQATADPSPAQESFTATATNAAEVLSSSASV